MKQEKPKRKNIVNKVYVLPEEQRQIQRQALAAGLSISEYLRRVGMGTPVKAVIDRSHIAKMSEVNADLGRLGGLLKLWLTDRDKRQGMEGDIRHVLRGIEKCQQQMLATLEKI